MSLKAKYNRNSPVNRRRSHLKLTLTLLSCTGLLVFSIIALTFSSRNFTGPDVAGCRNIYMYPSYMRVNGFDETHSRFSKKYSLFLYREQGRDPNFADHQGIPVLFIPGNAGSYKQARSVASQTTNLYMEKFKDANNDKVNLDFFTADFNEDLTAFHGRTMLDQAEYLNEAIKFILSLYEVKPEHERPKSVILIGHSMGGIVARLILTLPNYVDDTVNTIITLAAPHSAAPATFDGDILRIYSEMDNFWRSAFLDPARFPDVHEISKRRLRNVSLISITGGLTDNTLPADYTATNGLFPTNQSFNVFTTGIPGVYTPIDHLAIVWCDQLRKKLAKVLLDISTTTTPDCTYPIAERMAVFRKHLLSGFEELTRQDLVSYKIKKGSKDFDIRLKLDNDQINSNTLRIPAKINTASEHSKGKINMFNIEGDTKNYQFTLISSLPFTKIDDMMKASERYPSIVGCKTAAYENAKEPLIDYTTANTIKFAELDCVDLANDAHTIPRSMADTGSVVDSSYGGNDSPFHVIQYDPELISPFDAILVIESPVSLDSEKDFIIGEMQSTELTQLQLGDNSFWKLLTQGNDLSLPSRRPLAVDISIPAAWSSLLSYKVTISGISSLDMKKQKFAPFLRQSIDNPFETKWHVGIHNDDTRMISFHANPPFIQHQPENTTHLHLQLWTDSLMMDENPLDLYLSIDLAGSLKLLVLRYRLAVISFPVFICFLVFALQLRNFEQTGIFISFWDGLLNLCDKTIVLPILVVLALLTPLLNIKWVDSFLTLFNPVRLSEVHSEGYAKSSSFLGLRENYLLFLGPLFFIISIALVALVYQLIMIVGEIFTISYGFFLKPNSKTQKYSLASPPPMQESAQAHQLLQIFKTKRQVIGTALLLSAVSLYVPYQFAYVVCCILQAIVVFRTFIRFHYYHRFDDNPNFLSEEDDDDGLEEGKSLKAEAQTSRGPITNKMKKNEKKNVLNYYVTILNAMIWIIPINAPVLAVSIHNFSVRWSTPFSSHHNLLAILPILITVEKHVSGKMIQRSEKSRRLYTILCALSIYSAIFSLLFGIKNLFFLHHLLNLFLGVLLFSFQSYI